MSAIRYPPRLRCALLPTPIEQLPRYSATLPGVDVWIKRDDLTGFLLSGNKVRKLEFTLAQAMAEGAGGVVTCGGVNSNHCRATVALAARLGVSAHLFLRTPDGRRPARLQGNALLDGILGAEIRWITPDDYRRRDVLLREYVEQAAAKGLRLFAIPEGASDALGAMGYVAAVEEMLAQLAERQLRIDYVVHAIGSGGTTAGLCAGSDFHAAGWNILAFAVCDDEAYFQQKVSSIRAGMNRYGLEAPARPSRLSIIDRYKGKGYGLTTPEELAWYRDLARIEGILLDPCYTGKAFFGFHREILQGRIPPGSRALFLHTGGGFGNFAYAEEWQAVIDE